MMLAQVRKKIRYFLLLLLVYSCNNNSKTFKIYDKEHNLINEYLTLNGDTIQSNTFFKNGKLKYSYNNLFEVEKTYYPNGILRQIKKYKNDTPNGEWIFYNNVGFIEKKIMYSKDKPMLAWITKKQNDTLIEKYFKMISDSDGVILGSIYSYKGNIDNNKSNCLKIFTKDTIKYMDSIKLKFKYYGSYEDSVIVLEFGQLDSNLNLIESPNNIYAGTYNSKEITYTLPPSKKKGFIYVSGIFLYSSKLSKDKIYIGEYPFIKEIFVTPMTHEE